MDFSKPVTINDVLKMAKRRNKNIDKKKIKKAYDLAALQHKDQYRKSGEPYIIHPVYVAYIVANMGLDTDTICSALLHDVVEDTDITSEELENKFGKDVSLIVEGVTKLGKLFKSLDEKKVENYSKLFLAMKKDIRVILLKLADRLHNINTLQALRRDRQIAISEETLNLYAPIAHKLGMSEIKTGLQDNAFMYFNPEEYEKTKEKLDKRIKETKKDIDITVKNIKKSLSKNGISAEVILETKNIYNIYNKLKKTEIEEIKDLFTIKIITKHKRECYTVLGALNSAYQMLPNTFKDYIAIPRANMYQAIQEVIIGNNGIVVEANICVRDMYELSKYGITKYLSSNKEFQEKLSGLYDTIDLKQNIDDPMEFLNILAAELVEKEVYIFTTNGQIVVLPKDSTPIDFAYNMGDEYGKFISKCKINNREMPITTPLETGDIVEIIKGEQPLEVEEEMLKIVKTAKAKNMLLKQLTAKNIYQKGRKIYEFLVMGENRHDLALDLMKEIVDLNLNVYAFNIEITEKGKAKIAFTVETRKIEKIEKLSKKIKKVDTIISVENSN